MEMTTTTTDNLAYIVAIGTGRRRQERCYGDDLDAARQVAWNSGGDLYEIACDPDTGTEIPGTRLHIWPVAHETRNGETF